MAFETVTYAAAKGAAKTYTDSVVEALGHGMDYKGSVPTVDDLPSAPTKGDCYTVLTNGHEWVYDGAQWVDLSADLDNKQDLLVSGENIKTVNGNSILGSGNLQINVPTELSELSDDSTHRLVSDAEKTTWTDKQDQLVSGTNIKTINGSSIVGAGNVAIRTYQPVPETWNIDGMTDELIQDIVNDDSAVKGMAYLDTIGCLDLPEGLGSGEAIIEIISGEGEDKIILIKLNSADTPPYNWEFNSFDGSWRPCSMEYRNGYGINLEDNEFSIDEDIVVTHEALGEYHDNTKQDTLVSGTNLKTINNESLLGSGNISILGLPALPVDAATKTYTLQAVNGVLSWIETTWAN